MTLARRISMILAVGAVAVMAAVPAYAATRTFDFENTDPGPPPTPYGEPDNCAENSTPPLFNRPGLSGSTSPFVQAPSACGEGQTGGGNGNDGLLTSGFSYSGTNSEELRFSWTDKTDDESWVRDTSSGIVVFPRPVVHFGAGSSIEMKVLVFATDDLEQEVLAGALEFSLIVRETDKNLPLGVDAGTDLGDLEFVGVTGVDTTEDSVGLVDPPYTPSGGVSVTHDSTSSNWTTIKWTFKADPTKVDVSVDGGAAVEKSVIGFVGGDGSLDAPNYGRGTLDAVAIRKPVGDDTSVKMYVNIDDVVIDAPGVVDPVRVEGPVIAGPSQDVKVTYVDSSASAVTLYVNDVAQTPIAPGGASEVTFTGLNLSAGDKLEATQTIGSESPKSDPVYVLSAVVWSDNFDTYANQAAFDAVWLPTSGTEDFELARDQAYSCPQSAKEVAATIDPYRRYIDFVTEGVGSAVNGTDDVPLWLTWYYRHEAGSQARNYIQFRSYTSGTMAGGGLTHMYHVGTWNATVDQGPTNTGNYQARDVYDGGPGWFTLDQARLNDQWVKMQLKLTSSATAYYVNDVSVSALGPSPAVGWDLRNGPGDDITTVVLGSGLTNSGIPAWYDNISVSLGDTASDPFGAPLNLPIPTLAEPILPGATSVTVNSIDATATTVKLFVNGALVASPAATPPSQSIGVAALSPGDEVSVAQVLPAGESCNSAAVEVVGNTVGGLMFTLRIREDSGAGAGTPGDAVPRGTFSGYEHIGATTSYLTDGIVLSPSASYQNLSFSQADIAAGRIQPWLTYLGSDGILNSPSHPWYCLAGLSILPDPANALPGPYTVYIDNIVNNGTTAADFESYGSGTEVVFQNPTWSGSTAGFLETSPDISEVKPVEADTGNNALQVRWAWKSVTGGEWMRLTSYDASNQGNMLLNLDAAVPWSLNFRVKVCPLNPLSVVTGPVVDGQTTVTTTDVLEIADSVEVFSNGSSIGTAAGNGTATVDVTTSALVEGQMLGASQTLGAAVGCQGDGAVVGSGDPQSVLVCVCVRETANNELEWIGLSGVTSGSPQGTQVTQADGWKPVSFSESSTPTPVAFTGDGIITDWSNLTLEHIAIAIDPSDPDTGDYKVLIDSIANGATTIENFDSATVGDEVLFQEPRYSGTTDQDLLVTPNTSAVTDDDADSGTQSYKVNFQYLDETTQRYVRLTTSGFTEPALDLSTATGAPLTIKVKIAGPSGPACNTPPQDADDDGDVDLSDYGVFLDCYNGPNRAYGSSIVTDCACLDTDDDGDVDLTDYGAFLDCYNGPNKPPQAGC
jgi:hypothetical protein